MNEKKKLIFSVGSWKNLKDYEELDSIVLI